MEKHPVPPRPLFKYLTGERALQVLRDQTIRFTQPKYFNDPFEFFPSIDVERLKKEYLGKITRSRKISPEKRREILKQQFGEVVRRYVEEFARTTEEYGVLSLSHESDVPLMWSHYAENHTGLAIGFNLDHGIGPTHEEKKSDLICSSAPIIYSTEKASIPNDYGFFSALNTKDNCWSYEEEWRVIRRLGNLQQASETVFVAPFEKQSVRCVVLGARTPDKLRDEVFEVLRDYGVVHQLAATLDADAFTMDIDTAVGEMLRQADYAFDSKFLPGTKDFHQYVSEAKLYTAMELLDPNIKYERTKDSIDFNP